MARGQISAPGDRSTLGHLQDPETGRAFGRVESPAEAMDQNEDVLKEIVGFGCIPENSVRYPTDNSGVTTKKNSERFPASFANLKHQNVIGCWRFSRRL